MKKFDKICEDFEFRAVQRCGNLVDLEKCSKMSIWTQNLALIQPRTSLLKFDDLAEKSEKSSVSNFSTKVLALVGEPEDAGIGVVADGVAHRRKEVEAVRPRVLGGDGAYGRRRQLERAELHVDARLLDDHSARAVLDPKFRIA